MLCFELLLKKTDLVLQFGFDLVVKPLLASQFTICLSVSVLNIQLSLSLCLIDLLLQVLNVSIVLRSLFGIVVLSQFEVFVQFLDLQVKLLFLISESLELSLLIKACLDLKLELRV